MLSCSFGRDAEMRQASLLDLFVNDEPEQECILAIHFLVQSWLLGD